VKVPEQEMVMKLLAAGFRAVNAPSHEHARRGEAGPGPRLVPLWRKSDG
jgi:hypothetical protein